MLLYVVDRAGGGGGGSGQPKNPLDTPLQVSCAGFQEAFSYKKVSTYK